MPPRRRRTCAASCQPQLSHRLAQGADLARILRRAIAQRAFPARAAQRCLWPDAVEKSTQILTDGGVAMLDKEGYRPNVGIVLANARNEVFWGVITSYSIHYTKLYDLPVLPHGSFKFDSRRGTGFANPSLTF